MQSDGVVSDDNKVCNSRENFLFRATVSLPLTSNSNDYSSQKETENKAFTFPYMDKLSLSFDISDDVDDDFFSNEQSDKTPFRDWLDEEKSQMSKNELKRASFIVCSFWKLMARPTFWQPLAFMVERDTFPSRMTISSLWSRMEVINLRCPVRQPCKNGFP